MGLEAVCYAPAICLIEHDPADSSITNTFQQQRLDTYLKTEMECEVTGTWEHFELMNRKGTQF